VTLARFWEVGEEKCVRMEREGLNEQIPDDYSYNSSKKLFLCRRN
jgi:hypothetical protein